MIILIPKIPWMKKQNKKNRIYNVIVYMISPYKFWKQWILLFLTTTKLMWPILQILLELYHRNLLPPFSKGYPLSQNGKNSYRELIRHWGVRSCPKSFTILTTCRVVLYEFIPSQQKTVTFHLNAITRSSP